MSLGSSPTPEGDPLGLGVCDELPDPEAEAVIEPELDPLFEELREADELPDPEFELLFEPEFDPLFEALREADVLPDPEFELLFEPEFDPLFEALREADELPDPEFELLFEPEFDPLFEALREADVLPDPEFELLFEPEFDPLFEALREADELPDPEFELLFEPEFDPLFEVLREAMGLPNPEAGALFEPEPELKLDGLSEVDGLGEPETNGLSEPELEIDSLSEAIFVAASVPEEVSVSEGRGLAEEFPKGLGLTLKTSELAEGERAVAKAVGLAIKEEAPVEFKPAWKPVEFKGAAVAEARTACKGPNSSSVSPSLRAGGTKGVGTLYFIKKAAARPASRYPRVCMTEISTGSFRVRRKLSVC